MKAKAKTAVRRFTQCELSRQEMLLAAIASTLVLWAMILNAILP